MTPIPPSPQLGGALALVLVLLLSALQLPSSHAQDTESVSVDALLDIGLEGLMDYEVVAPTKSRTRLSESPGSVSLITYEQIRNSSARTIPELLRLVPGVHVRWNPMVQSIEIRSFGSNPFTNRVLLLIDGIPYNSWNKGGFPQHPGFDFFSIENIKHLEVIRGAGSALYGENAYNGVVNIVTLSGEEYRQTRASVFAGDRKMKSVTLTHGSKLGDDAAIFFSARAEEGRLPAAIWREADSLSSGQDLYVKANYKDLQLTYYRRQDTLDGFDDLVVPDLDARFTSSESIKQEVNIAAAKYRHESSDGRWNLEANLSYANRNGAHCGACHAASQSEEFAHKIDHGYQFFGNLQLGINSIENHAILLGTEFRRNSAGDSFDQVQVAADPEDRELQYEKAAYFIQDQISFPNQRLEAVVGLRYDAATSPELLGDNLFPRVALVAKPTDKLTLRAGWNESARYPSFVELYGNTNFIQIEAPPPVGVIVETNFLPNGNLRPERMSSLEFGAEYMFSKNLQGKIDVYQNDVEDTLAWVFRDDLVITENHPADARVRGVETELRFSAADRWSGFVNWSFQNEEQRGGGVDSAGHRLEFSYAPQHKVNAGLTFTSTDALSATMEWSWRSSHDAPIFWSELAFNEPGPARIDAYGYLNLHVRYRLPFDVGRSKQPLTLNFYGKNLGNETPTETLNGGDGHLAEVTGREFFIGIDYEWAN